MYNSEEEIDDIVVKPTNFSTRETLKKQAISTPKSTLNTIQLVNELKNEKRILANPNIKTINEEYEFFDEEFQKTTKDLKEKYRDFMKNQNSLSEERKSVYELENEYEDDFEVLENPSKANSIEKIKNNYKYDEEYPDEPYHFLGNELPEDGEDVPPEIPTIDHDEAMENLENQIESPKKTVKTTILSGTNNHINTQSFGTKEILNQNKSPKVKEDINQIQSTEKSNRIRTANFVVPQKKENALTPKQAKALDQYTINNYNFFFNENKKVDPSEPQKNKPNITPKKQNISVDYGRRNPVPPPKKSVLTPVNRREPPKIAEKEDLLNKSDLTSVRERPKRITPNRYEEIKRVELPHIRNESSASRTRNLSDESSRYRPRKIIQKEHKREKSQEKIESSILVQENNLENDMKPSPRLGENLSTDMNSATNISHLGDREKESHNSHAKIMLNSIATSTPHKSITSSTRVKSIISDQYFSERIEHLLNVDLRYKNDQEIIVHNNVLRRYLNETKEDLRRMLGKAINSHRDHSNTRHTSPHIKITKLEEDLNFNENLIQSYIKEAEGLAKTLRKATDLTYLSELDSKIEVIENRIKKIQREKKEFDLIQKKELYLCFGNNFLEPLVFDQDKNKINKFNQKRESYDLLARDIKILRKRNKKAGGLIKEQTSHLSEMNERYNKLRDIAIHFGIILDQKKKKEIENLQKKSSDLSRAITILEKSIFQKSKTYQYELNKFQNELNIEKKKLRKAHNDVKVLNKTNSGIKLQIEELEDIRDKFILSNRNQGDNLQSMEDNRFRVTQNETSTMALDTEKDDLDLDGEEKHFEGRSSKAKAASETTDAHLKGGDDIINDEEIEMIKKIEEKQEEERRRTIENGGQSDDDIINEEQKEIILDFQQVNKIPLDKKIELPDMWNKFQNLASISQLFEIDNKKNNNQIYANYNITQEFKIVQEAAFTMEERPELQFAGMDRSMRKLGDISSRPILSKNNSMTSSNNYTIAQKNNRKLTNTQNSDCNEDDEGYEEERISSPLRKIEEKHNEVQNSKHSAYRQGYKIKGNFEISESDERLEVLREREVENTKLKVIESETASTQRFEIRGSTISNDLTVKAINSQAPPTIAGSPVSDLTLKVDDHEKDSLQHHLDLKPTPTNKRQTNETKEKNFESKKPEPVIQVENSSRKYEEISYPKKENDILSTNENPFVTETKSSLNQNEKFRAAISQSNHQFTNNREKDQYASSIQEVLTLSDLQPLKIKTSVYTANERAIESQSGVNTLKPIEKKREHNLSEFLPGRNLKDEQKDKEKSFDFFDDNFDIDKINFENKGKRLFSQYKVEEAETNMNNQKENEQIKSPNLNFGLQDQPSVINQPRGGMPRRMKIGDNEKKKQEADLAKKFEKEGNDFFTDLGY